MHRAPLNYCSASACVVRGARESLAGRGWGGAMLFWLRWGKLCLGDDEGIRESYNQRNYVPSPERRMALIGKSYSSQKKQLTVTFTLSPVITAGAAPRPPSQGTGRSRLTSPGGRWHSGKNQCNSGIRANGGRLKSYGVLGRRPGNHG